MMIPRSQAERPPRPERSLRVSAPRKRLWLAWSLTATCWGCGGGEAPAPPVQPAPPANVPAAETPPVAPPVVPQPEPNANLSPETRWIGGIPYDVFFDQPLSIASDDRRVTGAPAEVPAAAGNAPAAMPVEQLAVPAVGKPASVNWQDILPMASLVEEVKVLRVRLSENLNTLAMFNKGTKAIANDAAVLSALAGIVTEHSESVSWKGKAKHVRDLARDIARNATGTGREKYTPCREAFEQLLIVLDGGAAPANAAQDQLPFSDYVNVSDLMLRIDSTFTGLKANVRAASDLKGDGGRVDRELRLLLACGAIISQPPFENTDQPAFQQQAAAFATALRAAREAGQAGDLDGFQKSLARVQTTCAECHRQYRSSDTGF